MARILLTLAGLSLLLTGSEAFAQRSPGGRRTPGFVNRPAISPYVSLFQSNNGGMNSYFAFVRPQQEMVKFMNQTTQQELAQRSLIQHEATQLQHSIEQAVQEGELSVRPTSNSRVMRPAGSFMQYSPFFPNGGNFQPRTR